MCCKLVFTETAIFHQNKSMFIEDIKTKSKICEFYEIQMTCIVHLQLFYGVVLLQ